MASGWLAVSQGVRLNPSQPKPANVQAVNPWQLRNKELLRRMDRELALTPEQHDHIEKIIANSQERTKALWKPIAPQMNREMQSVCEEIREELTPEQRKKFQTFSKARANHAAHHGSTNAPPAEGTNFISTNPAPASQ